MTLLEARLRKLLAPLDDEALETLASRGLLRRAYKDRDRGVIVRITGEDKGCLCMEVGDFTVSMPENGPAQASCSCPAMGVCQHILCAVMELRRKLPETAKREKPEDATLPLFNTSSVEIVMGITREQLEKWAGKTVLGAALRFALGTTSEVSAQSNLVVRFPTANAECHFIAGTGLDGCIVSGGKGRESRLVAAAVIAFQASRGVDWKSGRTDLLEESDGAPRTRGEVLTSCMGVFKEMIETGLARLSQTIEQRLTTLSVSALGVNLPRLSQEVRAVADECQWMRERDARADTGRLFRRMAQTYALAWALKQGGGMARADLVGWHRTRYDEVGSLDLSGVAAWPWRTASGFQGVTVLFWDHSSRQWNSWTESRPRHLVENYNVVARYVSDGPWEGIDSPAQASRCRMRLMKARRNFLGRLSASRQTRALVTAPAFLVATEAVI